MKRISILALILLSLTGLLQAQVSTSPNIGLLLPPHGYLNWDQPMINDFNLLDGILSGFTPAPGLTTQPPTDRAGLIVYCANVISPVAPCAQFFDSAGNNILKVNADKTITLGSGINGAWSGIISMGTGTATNTDFAGELTMVANSKSYTFNGTYVNHPACTASNETSTPANAGVKIVYTGPSPWVATFSTVGATDVISYICVTRG